MVVREAVPAPEQDAMTAPEPASAVVVVVVVEAIVSPAPESVTMPAPEPPVSLPATEHVAQNHSPSGTFFNEGVRQYM